MEHLLDDAELARRMGGGACLAAEAELSRRMSPRIRLYGLRHLRDEHAADDLAQQVMLTTLEALRAGRLREPEKIASFVLGTCRVVCQELRRRMQTTDRVMRGYAEVRPADAPSPAVPDIDREQLERCVQNLKERERAVVVFTFYDEKTRDDLTRFLGVSEANLRVIRHRAIQQLRQCLGAAA